jgi:hypothetical protein
MAFMIISGIQLLRKLKRPVVVRSPRHRSGEKNVLPRATVFARMVYSFCARAEGDVFERIASQIRPEGRRRIDELLTVADGDPRSMLFRLKEYPPRGTPQTIQEYMTCYHAAVRAAWNTSEIRGVSQDLIEPVTCRQASRCLVSQAAARSQALHHGLLFPRRDEENDSRSPDRDERSAPDQSRRK